MRRLDVEHSRSTHRALSRLAEPVRWKGIWAAVQDYDTQHRERMLLSMGFVPGFDALSWFGWNFNYPELGCRANQKNCARSSPADESLLDMSLRKIHLSNFTKALSGVNIQKPLKYLSFFWIVPLLLSPAQHVLFERSWNLTVQPVRLLAKPLWTLFVVTEF